LTTDKYLTVMTKIGTGSFFSMLEYYSSFNEKQNWTNETYTHKYS